MDPPYPKPRSCGPYPKPQCCGPHPKMAADPPPQHSDKDRSNGELRALDCNLSALCDHIQIEGFNSGSFSDIAVHAMGSTYHLHRLILSRSSYFRNMLHRPWKEAGAPVVTLHVDDKNVNVEAIAMSFAYLYGHYPKLNANNAFRVLAAASFLDLQDLCAICTDFIISELWTSNFLAYQVFAESQDYGIHGERVRNACWGYLCQSGAMELKEVLPKLSPQTLHALLTSDELYVPSEEKRFELALFALLAKGALHREELSEQGSSESEAGLPTLSGSSEGKGKNLMNSFSDLKLEPEVGNLNSKAGSEGCSTAHNLLAELAGVVNCGTGDPDSGQSARQTAYAQSNMEPMYSRGLDGSKTLKSSADTDVSNTSCTYAAASAGTRTIGLVNGGLAMEGPSEDTSFYRLDHNWLNRDQSRHGSSMMSSSCYGIVPNDWGKSGMPTLSWGGRVVGRRQIKNCAAENCGIGGEDYETFVDIFEGGFLLYSNMSFEALINVRKQLEELGFPCKAVNDSLWLQMLLSRRVQEICADTCKNCCYLNTSCACRQQFGYPHGVSATGYCIQEQDRNNSNNIGSVYVTEPAQGDGNGLCRPVRVHVRGPVDGLAGLGRGNTFVPAAAWPPTRFVFSRVPFGVGNRNCPQALANDDSEARGDQGGDLSGDGLTALVGLSQGGNNAANFHGDLTARGYETDLQSKLPGTSVGGPSGNAATVQMLDHSSDDDGIQWDSTSGSSISLDVKTPLSHFPPFRFGVEFEDVHRLSDGQVKHSAEVFYAGSLWKVSVQAFNDEDPQGRRTLGLFLHRRKAECPDSLRKVHVYIDTREKVTARYQLICPSKREVMVFGSFKQRGTLLPKAPKGWGWRSALLFDELPDLLQNGALRVAAIVQLV